MAKYILLFILSLLLVVICYCEDKSSLPSICTEEHGCKCTRTQAGYWIHVSCSCSATQELLEIRSEQLPTELIELEIKECKEVRILAGALSYQNALQRVKASGIGTLLVRKHAFLNSSAPSPLFQAENCSAVVVESLAWRGTRGPQSVAIERCDHVVIQPTAFSWIQDFRLKRVSRLELQKNAFSQQGAAIGKHGPATTVVIEDAILPEIPGSAFPSSAAELRLERSTVRAIRKDAFCGLNVLELTFKDCVLSKVERGALSPRTLLHRLTLDGVKDATLASQAVQSAVNFLSIQHSKFISISEGGINITVATVNLEHNTFEYTSSRALVFKEWDKLEVINNTFTSLNPSGIWSVSERTNGQFIFIDNTIGETNPSGGSLHFGLTDLEHLEVQIFGNKFHVSCHCSQLSWLKRELGPKAGEVSYNDKYLNYWVDSFQNTSLCVVTNVLARCFGEIDIGYMNMSTFWVKVCEAKAVINCKSAGDSNEDIIIALPFDPTRKNNTNGQKTFLLILISIGLIISLIILITYCYCKKIFIHNTNNYNSISYSINKFFNYLCYNRRNNNNNELPIDGTVRTNSIDHIDIHQSGVKRKRRRRKRPRRRDMGITVNEDLDLTDVTIGSSSDSEAGTDRTCSTFDSMPACEEKGTQTVPEPDDLTEELLKELKAKLNDPNYYSEAKDMIEHMYDLIKVEEEANKSKPSTSGSNNISRLNRCQQNSSSNNINDQSGSQVISKSSQHNNISEYEEDSSDDERYAVIKPPSNNVNGTTLSEYMEPKDRKQPVYTELPSVTTRAVGFLKSFLPKKKANKDEEIGGTPLSEYMEPTDAKVHVYTELGTSNMANRPLPNKPESDDSESE